MTLEEDLARRDLTINAIAESGRGQLIDPYGGRKDLAKRQLRHVSPAFREDRCGSSASPASPPSCRIFRCTKIRSH